MIPMTKEYDYRDRIYRGYVTARDKPLAPPTLEGLRPRLPYFKQPIRRHWDFTHQLAFTRVSIAQLLKSSGFSDVACFEDQPVSHGVVSTIRAMLWQFIRLSLLFYIAVETGEISRDAILSQNLLAVARRGD